LPILIQNISSDTAYVGYGNKISIITEALNKKGLWSPIERRYTYFCGTGLKSIILPPNEIVLSSIPYFTGNFKTKIRVRLAKNLSNEINALITEAKNKQIILNFSAKVVLFLWCRRHTDTNKKNKKCNALCSIESY